jgi:hypothetical protein
MRTLGISFLVLGLVLLAAGLISLMSRRKPAELKPVEQSRDEIDRQVRDRPTTEATSHELPSEERS